MVKYRVEEIEEGLKRRRVESAQLEFVGPQRPVTGADPREVNPVSACSTGVTERDKGKEETLWATHEVSSLANITNAINSKDFRPIAVLPVLYKLYSRVLYMLGETMSRSL